MNNRRTFSAIIICLIAVAITLLLFFTMVTERSTIQWLCLIFIIFAELFLAGSFVFVEAYAHKTSGLMLRAGVYTITIVYFVAAIVVSLAFLAGFTESVKWLVTIELVILAITIAIMVPLFASGKSVYEKNRSVLQSAALIKQLENSVMMLKNDSKNSKYYADIDKVYEAIRYCDCSIYVSTDDKISLKISELEEALGKDEDVRDELVKATIRDIILLSKKREAEARGIKSGGI